MAELDYTKLDKLLKVLYDGDNKNMVLIGETYDYLFRDEPDFVENSRDYINYMAELSGLDLATKCQFATQMKITPFGRQVHKAGGWIAYNKHLKLKEAREEKLRLKEVEASELSANASNKSMYAAYIAIFISVVLAIMQFVDGSNKQTEIELINKKIRALDSLYKLQNVKSLKVELHNDSFKKDKLKN